MLISRRVCSRAHVLNARGLTRLAAVQSRRGLVTLAIESSCDDTSVAVLEKHEESLAGPRATLHFHEKVTANNDAYNGIHPLVALNSHQSSLGNLVEKAIKQLPLSNGNGSPSRKPDFISVTRGPGMRSNLSVGLDTAKGLSLAWDIPLVGVHHMQAHALTPRLVTALDSVSRSSNPRPDFPFLSLLVSGGHSMLISSTNLVNHSILATTGDIALGDCLDKSARAILPHSAISAPYGRALERFAFPDGKASYHYHASPNREHEVQRRKTAWAWSFGPPLAESKGGRSSKRMAYSFSGLLTAVERFMRLELDPITGSPTITLRVPNEIGNDERRDMAREVQRVAFEHLGGRVLLHLASLTPHVRDQISTVVVSGGVAANGFLRHVLRSMLDARGFPHLELCFPPIEYCTDNAAMIAWAGIEMYEAGYRSDLSINPIRKWSLDPQAEDGGILGASGWSRV